MRWSLRALEPGPSPNKAAGVLWSNLRLGRSATVELQAWKAQEVRRWQVLVLASAWGSQGDRSHRANCFGWPSCRWLFGFAEVLAEGSDDVTAPYRLPKEDDELVWRRNLRVCSPRYMATGVCGSQDHVSWLLHAFWDLGTQVHAWKKIGFGWD